MIDFTLLFTVLILAIVGLLSSRYNARMSKDKELKVISMWILEFGFVLVILFSIGSLFLGFNIVGLAHVLSAFLGATVSYVVSVSVTYYYDDKASTFVKIREDSYNQTLQKELSNVRNTGHNQ